MVIVELFNGLELALHGTTLVYLSRVTFVDPRYRHAVCNHMFMNFVPVMPIGVDTVKAIIMKIAHRHLVTYHVSVAFDVM